MDVFLQQVVNALSLGGTYALLALGLAMVFSVLGLINFAHGDLMTITGYFLFFSIGFGIPLPIGLLLGILMAVLAAVVMERVAFRPVRDANTATMLLTSFAVSTVLHILFQNLISARPKAVPMPAFLTETISVFGVDVGVLQLLSILVTLTLLLALSQFLRRTNLGLAMRAAAFDFPVTRLMGINANAVIATAFAISGLLAGVAGFFWLAQRGSVDPLMGFLPVLKAFIAVVLGGLGSLPGAVLGGFVLGIIEVSLRAYLPNDLLPFRDAISLTLVIGLLLIRPEGLLGKADAAR